MSYYFDASVIVPLFIGKDQSDAVTRWLMTGTKTVVVSDLAATQFSAVLSRLVRCDKIAATRAHQLNARFDEWRADGPEPVENLPVDIEAAGRLVRQPLPKLMSAEAIHLATCRRLGLTLVTHDKDLTLIAARRGIECARPS